MQNKSIQDLLSFMLKSNHTYLDNLSDIKDTLVISQKEISSLQSKHELHSFSNVLQRITWVFGHVFDWCDYLEENNQLIDDIESGTEISNVLFAYEDDYTEYLSRFNSLIEQVELMVSEMDSIYNEIRTTYHSARFGQIHVANLNEILCNISLLKVVIKGLKYLENEIKSNEKTLQSYS